MPQTLRCTWLHYTDMTKWLRNWLIEEPLLTPGVKYLILFTFFHETKKEAGYESKGCDLESSWWKQAFESDGRREVDFRS